MNQGIPRKIDIKILLALILSFNLWGKEANQYLGDQLTNDRQIIESSGKNKEESPFIPNVVNKESQLKPLSPSSYGQLPLGITTEEINSKITSRDKVETQDGHIPGEFENRDSLVIHNMSESFKEFKKRSRSNFGFYFSKDTFNYKGQNDSFERIFRKSNKSKFPGLLRLSGQRFLFQGTWGRFGAGPNLGIGYNSGKSFFNDGVMSDSTITLWTFPADLAFSYELPIFSIINLGTAAGPSVMGMIQNRSDVNYQDNRKNLRELGRGYFYEFFIRFNLITIFSMDPYFLYKRYSATGFYLNLSYRTQEYTHFKNDQISVDGTNWALGLAYDFK